MNLVRSLHIGALAIFAAAACAQTVESRTAPLTSESTAELIKVSAEIQRLGQRSASISSVDRWQILWLHQHISEQVMAASLQVDATLAQIDNEIARANEVRGFLADRRDRAVSRTNLRKEQLLQTWIQVKRIDSLSSTEKINRLTSQPSESLKLSIDDFEDRGAMLQDVRARISYLKRDLGVLLTSLPAVNDQP